MRFKLVWLLLTWLCACQPEATPFPVDIPTPATATPTPGAPAPIRYALAPDMLALVTDHSPVESSVQITQLTEPVDLDTLGSQFDLIVAYGSYPDATPSPGIVTLSLAINTTVAPLDNPALAEWLQRALNPAALAAAINIPGIQGFPHEAVPLSTLRAALANAGWPDGLDLSLAYDNGIIVNALQTQLQALNLQVNAFPLQDLAGPTHLTLFAWTTPEQRANRTGDQSVVDLLTVPISYWAVPGLQITYSPQGWPIATRP